MLLLDWQPSTLRHAPLIQLARGEQTNATTSPISSARPKRPNGSSCFTNAAMPSGSACCRFHHDPPGNDDRPGRDGVDADVVARELLRQRLGQRVLRRLDGVVDHAAAGLPAEDRRDHHDHAGAPCAHVRDGGSRRPDGRVERLVEGLLPRLVWRVEQAGAAAEPDVVDEDVEPAEASDGLAARPRLCLAASRDPPRRRAPGRRRPRRSATSAAARESGSADRAQMHTRHPSAASDLALAKPSPRLDPVTMATLSVNCKSIDHFTPEVS